MRELVSKLQNVERQVAAERGELEFFGLMLREGAPGFWDLVIAAPWLGPRQLKELEYFTSRLKKFAKVKERLKLSRIVLLKRDSPILEEFLQTWNVEHGLVEFSCGHFEGLDFERGYVITCTRRAVAEVEQAS